MKRAARRVCDSVLSRFGYALVKTSLNPIQNPAHELRVGLDHVLARHLLETDDFFFIQIGAFDGVSFDPIAPYVKKYGWRGILVEPQKDYFHALVSNYAAHREHLIFVNCAIDRMSGQKTLYRVSAAARHLPDWTQGIASFDRNTILSCRREVPDIEDHIVEETVSCLTLDDLFAEHRVKKVDLFQVDAEGYDYEIIKMLDFKAVRPAIIHYESKHIPSAKQKELVVLLGAHGYLVATDGHDTLAYRGHAEGQS